MNLITIIFLPKGIDVNNTTLHVEEKIYKANSVR